MISPIHQPHNDRVIKSNSIYRCGIPAAILALQLFLFSTVAVQRAHCQSAAESKTTTELENGVTHLNPVKNKWQVGVQIATKSSRVKKMLVTIPIPADWPEQKVTLVNEELPPTIKDVSYRTLDQNLRQLVVTTGRLPAKELFEIKVTLAVTTKQAKGPDDTSVFKIPSRPIPKELKPMLGAGPQISFRNSKLRAKVKELTADKANAWEEVKSIFDWIRENVEYADMEATDSLKTFRKKKGGAEDLVGLFIAMCRAHKVPARTVWVEGHQHAEFCLVDDDKNLHWFPCQVAGLAEFGSMSEPRIILQKGDNMRVPEKKERQKIVVEYVECQCESPRQPTVNFIRKLLPADE